MVIRIRPGSSLILEYEIDLRSGIPLGTVADHVEKTIQQLRKMKTAPAFDAANQLEQWLNKKLNP